MASRPANSLPRWVIALISLIPLAGAIAGTARAVKATADATYVRRDTFTLYQQGESRRHLTDSLTYASDMREVRHYLAGLDSLARCDHGQRGYCR